MFGGRKRTLRKRTCRRGGVFVMNTTGGRRKTGRRKTGGGPMVWSWKTQ